MTRTQRLSALLPLLLSISATALAADVELEAMFESEAKVSKCPDGYYYGYRVGASLTTDVEFLQKGCIQKESVGTEGRFRKPKLIGGVGGHTEWTGNVIHFERSSSEKPWSKAKIETYAGYRKPDGKVTVFDKSGTKVLKEYFLHPSREDHPLSQKEYSEASGTLPCETFVRTCFLHSLTTH